MPPTVIEIDVDPASRVRQAQPEETRRRSRIMAKVRHAHIRSARDALFREQLDVLIEDLLEERKPDAETAEERAERMESNLLVVIGPSGAGKTSVIARTLRQHPICPGYGRKGKLSPIITVRVPSPCTVAELGREVSRATGYVIQRRTLTGAAVWSIVRNRLRALGVVVLHLDEFQDIPLTIDRTEQRKLRHLIRSLLVDEEYPIGLILSGLPDLEAFLVPDRSATRRGRWMTVDPLAVPDDYPRIAKAVRGLAAIAGLQVDEDGLPALLPRLVHAGCGLLGITIEEIHDAIRMALRRSAKRLEIGHFADAYAFRTGSAATWNPYIVDDFGSIDATRVLVRHDPQGHPAPESGGGRRDR